MKDSRQSEVSRPAPARSGQLPPDWMTHPFLRGMSTAHLATLEECAMVTEFEPGRAIFHEGEMANRFYVVLSGLVVVQRTLPDGTAQAIEYIGKGGVLGWSWLFPPHGLHFSAKAVEPTRAIFFYGTWLRDRCEENVELGYELAKRVVTVLMQRLEAVAAHLTPTVILRPQT